MNRREATKMTMMGLGGYSLMSRSSIFGQLGESRKKKRRFGVQLFTIPGLIEKDLRGTLQLLSEIGYKEVEFFGPYPFSNQQTKEAWQSIKDMLGLERNAFYGFSIDEVARMLEEYELTAPSLHADILTMRTGLQPMLEAVSRLQIRYLVIPALFGGRDTLEDYQRLADEFNALGAQMRDYGIQFVYHNHGYEHQEMQGEIPMHILLQNTDPNFVKFELDIFWMKAAGADPIEFLKRYPDRFKLMHLKDASEVFRFSGAGDTPEQWMEGFSKMSDPGDGVFDIKAILKQASKSGVQHFYLERDLAPDPIATLKNSFLNLSAM